MYIVQKKINVAANVKKLKVLKVSKYKYVLTIVLNEDAIDIRKHFLC